MRYQFFPSLIVRNPVFSYRDYDSIDYRELIRTNFFKTALYIASIDFYNELQKKEFDYDRLSESQQNTIKKYCNRACYRPTPFGAFSSLTPLQWGAEDNLVTFLPDELKLHLKIDYLSSLELCERLLGNEAKEVVMYRSNSSLYKVFNSFRYIRYDAGLQPKIPKRVFSINSLAASKVISQVIQFCASGRSMKEIIQFLAAKTKLHEQEVRIFVQQLIDEQVIIPGSGANITGEDSLEDLVQGLHAKNIRTDLTGKIEHIFHRLTNASANNFTNIIECAGELEGLLESNNTGRNPFYVVTERNKIAGSMDVKYQQVIQDGLHCLDRLIPFYENDALDKFRISFMEKFEGQDMPLLTVLDPEVGIGYENLEEVSKTDWLAKGVDFEVDPKTQERQLKWTAVNSLLATKMLQSNKSTGLYKIELTDQEIDRIEQEDKQYKMPPSMSVIFRVHGQSLYLESVGGASATTLIGRFSPFNDSFFAMAREIAQKEQAVNKDIVFAEIAHVCDIHAANINRRKHIRDFEIPVVVTSTLEETKQITLSDLYVSVANNQIILKSKSLNAIIIPRMSSAFNHFNSRLSVFRFLCDLQYQGIKSNFKLDISNFFPDLKIYPRVTYKSAILCLATWYLEAKDFAFIKTADKQAWYDAFQILAGAIRLPRYFSLIQHDNYLVFDRDNRDDIELFLSTIKNYTRLTLQEFIMEEENEQENTSALQSGKPLIGQYVASLYQEENVYEFAQTVIDKNQVGQPLIDQGAEWLYFKIYCHPVGSNELLCTVLLPLLNTLSQRGMISKWFFVRFKDPNYHIRLRLHVADEFLGAVIAMVCRKLKPSLYKRLIDKYNIDVYLREVERYSSRLINEVEYFFYRSSVLVLHHIKKNAGKDAATEDGKDLDIIMLSIEELLNAFSLSLPEKVSFLNSLYEGFYREFDDSKNLKKSLDKKYSDLRATLNAAWDKQDVMRKEYKRINSQFADSCKKLADKIQKIKYPGAAKMLADIIHMHLNRLFVQNARRSEMIIYYLLYKHYNSLLFKGKLISGQALGPDQPAV